MGKKYGTAAETIGKTIFSAIKPLYREGERQRRGRRSQHRSYYAEIPKWSQKEIVFGVLPRSIENAGTTFSARDLYYATRPLAYGHVGWPEGKTLDYGYFSQTLLTEYQEQYESIDGLWRDPRGHLHEPHTGTVLPLGTREVADYQFPPYTFDKVLYIEKEGEMPKLRAAGLAERYDMAIVSGKGYPAEAVRTLFERAQGGDYQLFVFHDADLDGYNIARVLREATRRMPAYSVDVVDIGLTVEDALKMDLEGEPFKRRKDISPELWSSLSEMAKEYLYQTHPYTSGVRGERFELNAILPDTRRVEYIERKLAENGVRGKVIPPDDELRRLVEERYRTLAAEWVSEVVDELFSMGEIKAAIADEYLQTFGLSDSCKQIEAHFQRNRGDSWRQALDVRLRGVREEHIAAFKGSVREKLKGRLEDD